MFNKNCILIVGFSLFSSAIHSMDDLWKGDDYEKNSEPQYLSAVNVIETAVKPVLKGSETILDVGCGTGRIVRRLASLASNGSVKGIDGSKNMIDYAKEQRITDYSNISFDTLDVVQLQDDNTYDLVTSFMCLHWLKDKDKLPALKAIHQSLKPDGKFIGSIAYGDTQHPLVHSFMEVAGSRRLLDDPEVQKTINNRLKTDDVQLYSGLFMKTGFNFELNKREEKYCFSDKESFTKWLKPLTKPNLEYFGINPNNSEILNDLVDNYLTRIDASKNGIYYILPIIAFKASKAQNQEK